MKLLTLFSLLFSFSSFAADINGCIKELKKIDLPVGFTVYLNPIAADGTPIVGIWEYAQFNGSDPKDIKYCFSFSNIDSSNEYELRINASSPSSYEPFARRLIESDYQNPLVIQVIPQTEVMDYAQFVKGRPNSIEGVVNDSKGRPIKNAIAVLKSTKQDGSLVFKQVETDKNGRFEINEIAVPTITREGQRIEGEYESSHQLIVKKDGHATINKLIEISKHIYKNGNTWRYEFYTNHTAMNERFYHKNKRAVLKFTLVEDEVSFSYSN